MLVLAPQLDAMVLGLASLSLATLNRELFEGLLPMFVGLGVMGLRNLRGVI